MLKTVSSIINALGAMNYKGTWNANTNTPTLASGAGVKGDYYVVSVAGTTTLDGISNWGIGDWAAFNGTTWQRLEGGADLNGVNLSVSGTSNLTGNVTYNNNLVQGTAAKGVNFTANTPAAGMTSQLLNWYEEGTWTPNQGGSVTVVGAYSSSGSYTRVGRTVTVTAIQSGATSISTSPNGQLFTNLPFTVGGGVTRYSGMTALQFTGATGAVAIGGTTNVYCCGSLSGGDTIVTTITYEV